MLVKDCTISADRVLPHSEIVLQRPTQYFRILRLYYFGPHSTSAFRDCTTTADRVLPRSERVLQRPTEYFRVPRVYFDFEKRRKVTHSAQYFQI